MRISQELLLDRRDLRNSVRYCPDLLLRHTGSYELVKQRDRVVETWRTWLLTTSHNSRTITITLAIKSMVFMAETERLSAPQYATEYEPGRRLATFVQFML